MYRFIMAFTILLTMTVQAQDNWEQKYPSNVPPARSAHLLADIGTGKVLMFGGALADNVSPATGTWIYDLATNTWTSMNPSGDVPDPRILHSMSYIGDDKVLLYGGYVGPWPLYSAWPEIYDNGTYVYDLSANTWTEISPVTGPPAPTYISSLAYAGEDRVVLFGGYDPSYNVGGTWVFDLSDMEWTEQSPSVTPQIGAHPAPMISAGGGQVLMYGVSTTYYDYSEMWLYDLSSDSWTLKLVTASPEASYDTRLAPLAGSDQALLFGGDGTASWQPIGNRIYDLGDNTWTVMYPQASPSLSRVSHAMATVGTGKVLMFGGWEGFATYNDTWVYTATIAATTFQITATSGAGGSISPSGSVTVSQGGTQGFVYTADPGYEVSAVTVDGASLPNPGTSYTFSNVTTNHTIGVEFAPIPGSIAGTVSAGGAGLGGITVKLLDVNGIPVSGISPVTTGSSGAYAFNLLAPASYQLMIVEPLGYLADQNPKSVTVLPGAAHTIDFALTQVATSNNARGKGYWKHQFDVHVNSQGQAQETAAQLSGYITAVHARYTPHCGLFSGLTSFSGWQGVLTVSGNQPTAVRAKAQLAALLMNVMSLKVGQSAIATADGRSVADVLTYVSALLSDNSTTNDGFARDLAESVNQQQLIGAGIVPVGSIVYKENESRHSGSDARFRLEQNYPNPFNPSTVIGYAIQDDGHVRLRVFDMTGRVVATLVNERKAAGSYNVIFDAGDLPGGQYGYVLESRGQTRAGSMSLVK